MKTRNLHAAALAVLLVSTLGLTGCLGDMVAERNLTRKLVADHPGFKVVSLEKQKVGHRDGVGDTYEFILASESGPAVRIASAIKLVGAPMYVDNDLVSTAAQSPYTLSPKARTAFLAALARDFPGKTYYPNQEIAKVAASPAEVKGYLLAGVKGKGDPDEYYLVQLAPHDIKSKMANDITNSALYYHDPTTDEWRLVAKSAGAFMADARRDQAGRGKSFASPKALMEAVIAAIRTDAGLVSDYYDPRRVQLQSRTSFPPSEEVRRQLLTAFKYADLSYDVVKRHEPRTDMAGVEIWYVGHILKDGKAVRNVEIAQSGSRYYIAAIEQSTLLPKYP